MTDFSKGQKLQNDECLQDIPNFKWDSIVRIRSVVVLSIPRIPIQRVVVHAVSMHIINFRALR